MASTLERSSRRNAERAFGGHDADQLIGCRPAAASRSDVFVGRGSHATCFAQIFSCLYVILNIYGYYCFKFTFSIILSNILGVSESFSIFFMHEIRRYHFED